MSIVGLERKLGIRVLTGKPLEAIDKAYTRKMLLRIAEDSIKSEENHILHSIQTLIHQTGEQLDNQVNDRLELVDTFFEGIR
mgnify:CR=1 FL=1